ncbi:protein-tyrosine phosphatase family protein [Microlunatus speluncae]|uniref:protein-tyrosine phosphatase family protein n=1 Tax=Microlunatus speluncae TaxID=2594267 RepID=UPI001266652B|nr:protein-tyrosine phosphatase family protein [Microlunatus speluncae]
MEQLVGAIALPDETLVRGRGRRQAVPAGPVPEYGLCLGRFSPRRQPDWPADWIDWPDFRLPRDNAAAVELIKKTYDLARTGRRVEVSCGGGNGRTGTVIACLAVLAGHPAEDAVAWTREHYRRHAVETRGQRRWIAWFAESV